MPSPQTIVYFLLQYCPHTGTVPCCTLRSGLLISAHMTLVVGYGMSIAAPPMPHSTSSEASQIHAGPPMYRITPVTSVHRPSPPPTQCGLYRFLTLQPTLRLFSLRPAPGRGVPSKPPDSPQWPTHLVPAQGGTCRGPALCLAVHAC